MMTPKQQKIVEKIDAIEKAQPTAPTTEDKYNEWTKTKNYKDFIQQVTNNVIKKK